MLSFIAIAIIAVAVGASILVLLEAIAEVIGYAWLAFTIIWVAALMWAGWYLNTHE